MSHLLSATRITHIEVKAINMYFILKCFIHLLTFNEILNVLDDINKTFTKF